MTTPTARDGLLNLRLQCDDFMNYETLLLSLTPRLQPGERGQRGCKEAFQRFVCHRRSR
jgi:hypothetical protein